MYQRDPVGALRQIARLVRSGGRVVVVEYLQDPSYTYTGTFPPLPALVCHLRLFWSLVERKGGTPAVARQLRRICEQADLRVIEETGRFRVPDDPPELLAWLRDSLLGMRSNLVAENLATDEDIDALAREMDEARDTATYATGPLNVEMIAEVP